MAAAKEKKNTKVVPISAAKGTPEDKKKALEEALKRIERDYGKGTIMRLGEDIPVNVEALSTGSLYHVYPTLWQSPKSLPQG